MFQGTETGDVYIFSKGLRKVEGEQLMRHRIRLKQ